MSRRSHVVRADDQGGVGAPRSLGGCEILCSTADRGDIAGSATTIASIAIEAGSDYRRCLVAATVGQIGAFVPDPVEFQYDWYLFIGNDVGIQPSESPHWIVTADPAGSGNIPLIDVTWSGKALVGGTVGEGGTVEFWIDDVLIHTFNSEPGTGEVDAQFPFDLTGLGMQLVPGQQCYFKAISGEWSESGWTIGGWVGMRGSQTRTNVNLDW